jgi:hypothetical protein
MNENTNKKLIEYIVNEIIDDYHDGAVYISDKFKTCSFSGHHQISFLELKEIANILNVENVWLESKTEKWYGDKETIIKW